MLGAESQKYFRSLTPAEWLQYMRVTDKLSIGKLVLDQEKTVYGGFNWDTNNNGLLTPASNFTLEDAHALREQDFDNTQGSQE